ncbi:MAG: PHP domain-containing protein [Desulfovibrio sp.]|nr:PHP domain-containing protein [Desulfovibrio sp.]
MDSIDLHTHSTFSDGSKTPEELVWEAKACGLHALALTDHDTCNGLDLAVHAASAANIHFVRGCELSAHSELGELHILGLWVPPKSAALENTLAMLRQRRCTRNEKMVEKLCQLGLPLSMEDLLACAGTQTTVGRPHIALAMIQKGYVRSLKEAFKQYLGFGAKAYVSREVFPAQEAVRVLSRLGATVALAHPMIHHYPRQWLRKQIMLLMEVGLDALEVWHTEHSEQDSAFCLQLAHELGLGVSGGSDYHGKNKPTVLLGRGHGNLAVSVQVLHDLEERRRSKGLPC